MAGPLTDDQAFAAIGEGPPDAGAAALSAPPQAPPPLAQPQQVLSDDEAFQVLEGQEAQRAKLMRYRAATDGAPPERRARVLKYAAATGIPPELVERNFDELKRKVDAAGVDWVQLRREQPGLRQYLDDRPEGHPLVQDDLEQLHGVEWGLKATKLKLSDATATTADSLLAALQYVNHELLGINRPTIKLGEETASTAEKVFGGPAQPSAPAHITDALQAAAGIGAAPPTAEQLAGERGTYGAESTAQKALVGSAGAVPFLVGNTAAAATAGPAGIVAFNAAAVRGDMEQRFQNIRTPDGEPLERDTVETSANLAALTNGALQLVPVGHLVGLFGRGAAAIPLAKQLTQGFAASAVERVLVQPGATALLRRAVSEWGTHTLTAGVAMGLQGAVNQGAEEALKGTAGQDVHLGNMADAFARDFISGMRDMALLSVTGPGMELLHDTRALADSRAKAAKYAELVAAASASKMRARSPEEFQRAVGAMAEQPGAARDIGVPVEAWNTYWQAHKVDPAQVAEHLLGDGGTAYQQALATKGDLAIPSERYLAQLPPEHLLGLAPDARVGPDVLTPREAKGATVLLQARLAEQAKARGGEIEAGKAEVEAFIRDQAVAAGVAKEDAAANAKLVAEYAGTTALRMGVSVQDAARLGGLDRLSILGPKGEAVAAAARERFGQFLTASASGHLANRLTTMSPEARAREFYVDPVSGLRNRRAFDAAPAPEGKQVAVITAADIKAINDHPAGGHDVANHLLRVLGQAVGEADPEAARSGTNFLLRVKDQAELDQVLQKVRAALPDKRLSVEGALGGTPQEAGKALDARVDERRAAGELPPRGQLPGGVDVAKLAFPEGRAAATVPPELVAELGGLSPEEYFRRAYQDERSPGILSREGWDAIPRKAYVASLDLRGLKDLNKQLGKAAGDEVLRQFGEVAGHFGGSSFDFSHLSGDEYAAQSDDPARLEAFLDRLRAKAHLYVQFTVEREDGSAVRVNGADFRAGTARGSYGAADRELNAAKRQEQGAGAGRVGEPASDQAPRNPPGVEAQGNPDGRSGDLAGGGSADGRGAPEAGAGGAPDRGAVAPPELGRGSTPQGFPGAELHQAALGDTSFDFGANAGSNVGHLEGEPVTYGPGMREARALIGRMRGERQATAKAFLDYALGLTEKRPEISAELERKLGEFGVVDPAGFTFDETGREMARPIGGRKKLNVEPPSLREYRLRRQGMFSGYGDQYEQAALAGGDTTLYQPPAGDGEGPRPPPRGSISMRVTPEGRPVDFRIEALRGDRSTLAHETAHFLSWSLHELATSDLASPDLRADYDALLKWAGYDSPEERLRERDPAREEKFSHGWEQYLAEGKAPSRALARVFSRFKGWMLRIYNGISSIGAQYKAQHGEELQLSDEVRGVFDRLLVGDEGLQRARDESGRPAQPEAAALAGMTPPESEAYRQAFADAQAAADTEVAQRAAELQRGEVGQFRAKVEGEVAAELDRQPRYRLWRFLQRGELADGKGGALLERAIPELFRDKDGQPLRLSREAVREQFGQRVEEKLGPLLTRKGGVGADQLAPLFGYEDGQEMVSELFLSAPRDQVLQEKTQERVDARYGPALAHIQEAATRAIHGDEAARATLLALRGLAKQVDPGAARRVHSIDLDTLKATAGRMVSETPVGALSPERYLRAERETTKRAERLWGAGRKAEALDEREAALLNQVLYRAARDTQERLERARARLEGTSDDIRAQLGKADPAYRDVYDSLLKAVELGSGPVDPATALGLDAMLERAKADAQELDFDVPAIRALLAQGAPWDRLTADEAQNVVDAAENLRTAARRRNEVTLAGKVQTKDAFFARMASHLGQRKPLPPESYTTRERTLREQAASLKRGVESDLMDVGETLAHLLDAGERGGPAHELLVDGRLAARDAEVELTREVLDKVHAAYHDMPEALRKLAGSKVAGLEQLLPSPAEGRVRAPSTRDSLYSLYLNWGNEGNRQRIRDGNGWSDDQVQRALNLLQPHEVKFLQGILDVVDQGLWEKLAKVYEGRTGLPLEKVRAAEISVNGQSTRGGYFPIRYDERNSRPGEMQADAETVAGLFQGNYRRAAVSSGHTKERAEKVDAAVLLDWNVLPAHLAQVIHDVTYGDWVRQAGSLVLDQRFKEMTAEYLGTERRAQLVPWLQDVANARADSAAGALSQAARTIGSVARGRLAVAALAFNVKAFGLHTFDPWKATWENVGLGRIAASYVKVMAPWNWGSFKEFGLSKEIGAREVNFKEDLRRTLSSAGLGEPGLWRKLGETQFRLYEWIDRFTSRVTFKAAFDGARAEGLPEQEASRRADDAVRRVLASHDIAEKPRLMRSKSGWGAIVMFYGYANRGWNQRFRARDDVARLWGNEDATTAEKASAVANYAAKMLALAVIGTGAAYMAGRGPKKKDDAPGWVASSVLLEPLHEWPLIGGVAEKVMKGERADARTEPGLAYMLDTINRVEDLVHKAHSNQLSGEEKVWAAVDSVLGLTLGGQAAETADYAHQLATGKAHPRGPGDVASGLLYGQRKEPVHTPLADLQTLLGR